MSNKRRHFRAIKFSKRSTHSVREWCIENFGEEWGGRNFEGRWQLLWNGSNAEEGKEYTFFYDDDEAGIMFSMRWL